MARAPPWQNRLCLGPRAGKMRRFTRPPPFPFMPVPVPQTLAATSDRRLIDAPDRRMTHRMPLRMPGR